MSKFFISRDQIGDNMIMVTGDDYKHIKNVLRGKIGHSLILCDGEWDYSCEIKEIQKDRLITAILEKTASYEPGVKITLYQGLPKSDKMELIIQKCVELGVCKIVPVNSERVISKTDTQKKLERWNKISEAAAKQSNRGKVPEVLPVLDFKAAASEGVLGGIAIMAYEKEEETGLRDAMCRLKNKDISVFIGPEGGFSPAEVAYAKEKGVISVSLGKRILRTETAGMAVLTILLYELE